LALEIQRARTSGHSSRPAEADRDHGDSESHVRRRTDCRRAPSQARASDLAANRQTVHASETMARDDRNAGVEHAYPKSRPDRPRERLFVAVTPRFRMLHVFVVLEVGTRRILHWNVKAHPTAEWTARG
jgi:hypothetical protein